MFYITTCRQWCSRAIVGETVGCALIVGGLLANGVGGGDGYVVGDSDTDGRNEGGSDGKSHIAGEAGTPLS